MDGVDWCTASLLNEREKASLEPPAAKRVDTTVERSASTLTMRSPETCSARSHQCEPMSASAEMTPPLTGSIRQDPRRIGHPILQVVSVDRDKFAGFPGGDTCARLLNHAVTSIVEGNSVDYPSFFSCVAQLGAFLGSHRQWLVADYMLSGAYCGQRDGGTLQVVRRGV